MTNKLILIELNEINFDVVRLYIDRSPGSFPAMERLLGGLGVRTGSEVDYEKLEPWIQWPSVHTGKSYDEHQIFRLGDITGTKVPQIFEQLEAVGLKVGAISAMNAENRLQSPAYFIPDPWTDTPTDGSWWSRKLSGAVSQAVNDNSRGRITVSSLLILVAGLCRFARPSNYGLYLKLALMARGAPWRKALFLDLFLHDLHMRLMKRRPADFSTLFLNAGAHIQHHYFLNAKPLRTDALMRNPAWYVDSEEDPVGEMLALYDRIILDYLDLPKTEVIVATGLSQKPYDRVKFYYRLKDHASFLSRIGVVFSSVAPRMTRDFLLEFESVEAAVTAQETLSSVRASRDDVAVFGEIDNRGTSLFVTLTYPNEIRQGDKIEINGRSWPFFSEVAFVAVKNGMHQADGFAYFTPGLVSCAPRNGEHVKSIHTTISRHFDHAFGRVA